MLDLMPHGVPHLQIPIPILSTQNLVSYKEIFPHSVIGIDRAILLTYITWDEVTTIYWSTKLKKDESHRCSEHCNGGK